MIDLDRLENAGLAALIKAAQDGDTIAAKRLVQLARTKREADEKAARTSRWDEQVAIAEAMFADGASYREVTNDPRISASSKTVRRWRTRWGKAQKLKRPATVPTSAEEQATWRLTLSSDEADRAILADMIRQRDACKGETSKARLTSEIAKLTRELRPDIEDEDPLESMTDEELIEVTIDSMRGLEPHQVEPIALACVEILGAAWFRAELAILRVV